MALLRDKKIFLQSPQHSSIWRISLMKKPLINLTILFFIFFSTGISGAENNELTLAITGDIQGKLTAGPG